MHETDKGFMKNEEFTSEKGTKFTIAPNEGALWRITMHGGGKPPIMCDDSFTSYNKARQTVIRYINETDRMGYAVHPDKPKARGA
jgi:hypothetical protein